LKGDWNDMQALSIKAYRLYKVTHLNPVWVPECFNDIKIKSSLVEAAFLLFKV